MLILCLTCLIICFIGFLVNKEITMYEFILNCVISLVVSLILFGFMLIPVPNDFNYMSGKMIKTSHYPAFVEEYEQQHTSTYACGTDSEGHTKYCTRVWYTTEHERHPEYWTKEDSLGQSWEIKQPEYDKLRVAFEYFYVNVRLHRLRRAVYAYCAHNKNKRQKKHPLP